MCVYCKGRRLFSTEASADPLQSSKVSLGLYHELCVLRGNGFKIKIPNYVSVFCKWLSKSTDF